MFVHFSFIHFLNQLRVLQHVGLDYAPEHVLSVLGGISVDLVVTSCRKHNTDRDHFRSLVTKQMHVDRNHIQQGLRDPRDLLDRAFVRLSEHFNQGVGLLLLLVAADCV